MWNKLRMADTDKGSKHLPLNRNKKAVVLKQRMVMTIIFLFTTISTLAIYKFDWVKINVKHGESLLQIEGGSLDQRN